MEHLYYVNFKMVEKNYSSETKRKEDDMLFLTERQNLLPFFPNIVKTYLFSVS